MFTIKVSTTHNTEEYYPAFSSDFSARYVARGFVDLPCVARALVIDNETGEITWDSATLDF